MEQQEILSTGAYVALTAECIAARLADFCYTGAPLGDHSLNPGWALDPPQRAAAVLILLVQKEDGLHIVFTQRTSHLHAHAGQVSFPGGGVEPQDTDAIATALREGAEETGLDPEAVRILGALSPYLTRSGFMVTPVVGFLAQEPDWQPDPFEVAQMFDVPLAHFLTAGNLTRRQVVHSGMQRYYYGCDWQVGADKFLIWGATAGMLQHFVHILLESDL